MTGTMTSFTEKNPHTPKQEKKKRKKRKTTTTTTTTNKQTNNNNNKNEKLSRIGEYVSKLSLELLYLTIFVFSIVKIKWDFNYAISGEARRSTAGAELDI